MDWKSTKRILLIVFFILNIVLAVTLSNSFKVEEISQQTIINTQTILEKNNVLIECPIPKYSKNDYTLQYEEKVLDDKIDIATKLLGDNYVKTVDNVFKSGTKSLVFTSDCSFEYNDTGDSEKLYTVSKSGIDLYLKEKLKDLGLPFDEFKQDGYYKDIKTNNEDGVRVVYKGQYKGYIVFDNYIEVQISKASIRSIKYTYKRPISITSRDINVIPAYEILITKMTNYPGITIIDVNMGFKGYTNVDKETKTLYEGLCWRIKSLEGKEYKEYYFNARNGQEME